MFKCVFSNVYARENLNSCGFLQGFKENQIYSYPCIAFPIFIPACALPCCLPRPDFPVSCSPYARTVTVSELPKVEIRSLCSEPCGVQLPGTCSCVRSRGMDWWERWEQPLSRTSVARRISWWTARYIYCLYGPVTVLRLYLEICLVCYHIYNWLISIADKLTCELVSWTQEKSD